ncbi:Craniofacial development protein 2 [Chionoecetes opilio]|uniref:Craniofacial development protein 2 n=1 Tax=Chionoecetes opilio TaxID=41210 RepID=A0A8J4Z4Q1_CHIOP|nr:Craniofacial development protein 2 [Chionoecetes opilio]
MAQGETNRRCRPILLMLQDETQRQYILEQAKKLKTAGEAFNKIYVKKDIHPAMRKEWKRLHDAERTEKERAGNVGCVIHFNTRERKLYRDGVVIDSWNLQPSENLKLFSSNMTNGFVVIGDMNWERSAYDECGASLRESSTLNQVVGPPSPNFSCGGGRGGAEAAPARRITSEINLRRVLRVGSWNVLSLSDNHRLPLLSGELSRLKVDIVGLSETRRPGSGETSSGGYTYYWSGLSNGHRVRGVAIGISSKLQPSVVEVTPVDERILRVRMKHTLGFMSLVAVYAPTRMRKTEEKEMFYAKLDSVLDQCPPRDTLIVLGDFNATTGTVRDGYELCGGPHGSGTRNTNSSLLLNFARFRRLRIAGSWYQRPELHRWTWHSNAGGVAKEIDHILVSTRWRILQNCRVYRRAEFFGTYHRLVVATLELHSFSVSS